MQIKRSEEGLLEKIDILANDLEINMISVLELNAYFKECGDVIRSLLKELEPYKAIGTAWEFKNLKCPDLIQCKDGTYAYAGDVVSIRSYSERTGQYKEATGEIYEIGFDDDDYLYVNISLSDGTLDTFIYNSDYDNEVEVLVRNVDVPQYEEQLKLEAEENKKKHVESHTERFYIKVPFSEKDEAKRFAAKWDAEAKLWYYTNKENSCRFAKWEEKETALEER